MWRGLMVCLLLMMGGETLAQKEDVRKDKWTRSADELVRRGNFQEAFRLYSKLDSLYPGNARYAFAMGLCTFQAFDKPSSLPFFLKAKYLGDTRPIVDYYLGKAYYFSNGIEQALHYLNQYKETLGEPGEENKIKRTDVDQLLSQISSSRSVLEQQLSLDITNMGATVNSAQADYVPVVIANGTQLVFTSRRHKSTGGKIASDGAHFEDIYISHKDSSGNWNHPVHFHEFNSPRHDANIALSHDGSKLFIYKASHNGDLFYSEKNKEKWSPLKSLKGINTPFWEGSACLSFDETTLYFSSDRPGGYGGSDLYKAEYSSNGTWINITNLGPAVNTSQDEDAPYIYKDAKTLFFSSKGHNAIGGYDIFSSQLNAEGAWTQAKNMGFPISTFDDDIYFHLNTDGSVGYFTSFRHSNFREKSIGEKDLFQIRRPNASPMQFILKGKVTDRAGNEPLAAIVTLKDLANNEQNQLSDIATGTFKFDLQFENKYLLTVEIAGKIYSSSELSFPYQADLFEYFLPIELDSIPTFDLKLADLIAEAKTNSKSVIVDNKEHAIMLVHKVAPDDADLKKLLESDNIPFSFRNKISEQLEQTTFLDQLKEGDQKQDRLADLRDTSWMRPPEKLELPSTQQTRSIDAATARQNYEYSAIQRDTTAARKDRQMYDRLSSIEQSLIARLADQLVRPDSSYLVATSDLLYYENLTQEEKRIFKSIVIHHATDIAPCSDEEEAIRFQMLEQLLESNKIKALAKSNLAFYDHESWEVLYTIETDGFEKHTRLQFNATLIKRNNGSTVGEKKLIVVDDDGQLAAEVITDHNGHLTLSNLVPGKRYHILIDDYTVSLSGSSRYALRDISLIPLEEDYMAFYQKLTPERKRRVDRLAAAVVLKQHYQDNPELIWEDALRSGDSTADNQFITAFQHYLQAQDPDTDSFSLDKELSQQYEETDPSRREEYDRLIARAALLTTDNDIAVPARDSVFFEELTEQEKGYIQSIAAHRARTKHLMGEWVWNESADQYWYDLQEINTQIKDAAHVKVTGKIENKATRDQRVYTIALMNESGQLIRTVHSDSSGRFVFSSVDANRKLKILLKKPPVGTVTDYSLSELRIEADTIPIYDSLSLTRRRRIDRIIARNLVNQADTRDPSLKIHDEETYEKLSHQGKAFIDRLQNYLFADTVTEKNSFLEKEDHRQYYNRLTEKERQFINRYTVRSFKDTLLTPTLLLEDKDNLTYSQLSVNQKQQIILTQKQRMITNDLFGENPVLFVASRRVLLDSITPPSVIKYYAVRGQLTNRESGEPISNTQVYLSSREGSILAMVTTDASGEFQFEKQSSKEELFALAESNTTSFFGSALYQLNNFRIVTPDTLVNTNHPRENLALEIYFDFNSSLLRPEALRQLISWVNKNEWIKTPAVIVTGHTDIKGTVRYNQKLSERRAEVVAAVIKKQSRIHVVHVQGFGKAILKYPGDSLNRRVEIQFSNSHTGLQKK